MKCKILHESAGRMRVHLNCRRMTLHQADVLEYYLRSVDGVREVSVFDRTQDAVIVYRAGRAALVHALAAFSFDKAETMDLVPDHTTRELNREFEDKLSWTVIRRVISKLFFPLPVTTALAIYHSINDSAMRFQNSLLSVRIFLRVDRHGQGAFHHEYRC